MGIASLWQDVRGGVRMLRKQPAFAAAVIATLGLGIGFSTAIFSIVNAVLLRPLPYHQPDRLVRIWESNPSEGVVRSPVSAAIANDWRVRSQSFADVALFDLSADPTVLGVGDESLQLRQAIVTPNLFALLGVRPAIGREFGAAPERSGPLDGREVIVSHALWQRAFGSNPAVIGQTVRIEGAAGNVVVGVMPLGFSFPEGTDFWTPTRATSIRRDWREFGAVGRLAENATLSVAASDLRQIAASLANEHPDTNAQWTADLTSLHDSVVGNHRLALITLFAAVAFVVLVGCANVSNLLLTRGIARRGELAVRTALGASRARIARLLMAETAVLSLVGGAAGWAIARVLLPVMVQLAGSNVPRLDDARLSSEALAYAAAATVLAALVAGIMPAIRLSRADPRTTISADGERTTRLRTDIRVQRAIVAAELAACLVLLVGATLFAQTFVRLNAVDLGFDPAHVVSIETRVPIYRSLTPDRWQRVASDMTDALHRLRSIPGVQAVSSTSDLPLAGNLLTADVTLADDESPRQAFYHRVSPDYFKTMGMTLVAGRDFTNEDISDLARLPAMPDPRTLVPRRGAVIVNETAARMLWPSANALGQFLSTSFDTRAIGRRQVVGIVRDVRSETLRNAPPPEVYVPYLEDPGFVMTLLVRTTVPVERIVPIIRDELREVSTDMSTANVRRLENVVRDSTRSSRFGALVIGAFAIAALLLSALGVFGVFSFGVATRVREIGIRMALGATRRDIMRMFLKQAVGPIGAGVVLGTAGALALGRLIQALLFGVEPTDVFSYAAAASVLVIVALTASYLPVRRVLSTDPARSLRG